ncbi:MAG: hypothetical protein CVT78_13755 [Alphaproteobacteria bacterium HGW-Alphaproteobacteria-17]|nr:MAG: hypothetical protein CVT78_13755 [Alphaproteobacteria bacterium HGW-Alphaproteobacteria-17]
MRPKKRHAMFLPAIALASCSFGPRLETAMPQIRSIPVLADLSAPESLVRARTFLAAKQYGLAIELYKAASRDPALAAESLNGLAVAYDGIGRRDLAERYFQRALAARPGDARTKRNLAAFYATSGQDDKRQNLLAESASGSAAFGEVQVDRPVATTANAPVAEVSRFAALDVRSPLGSSFRPLMVQASLGPASGRAPMATAGAEATIMCVRGNGLDRPTSDDSVVEAFRVSLGEIFIITRPNDANCTLQPGNDVNGHGSAPPSLSNREYLGLVAEQLDRLNSEMVPVADLSRLWRAIFWVQDGQA